MNIDVSSLARKGLMVLKENMPKILIGSGIVTGGACVFMTGKRSVKLPAVLDAHKERVTDIRAKEENPETKKALAGAYLKTGGEIAKLYAPAAVLGTTSVVCILSGSHILSQRNAALTAAYATLDASYRHYRENAIKRHGKDEDDILRFGTDEKKETVKVADEKTGKSKKTERSVSVYPSAMPSDYARYFDKETSTAYEGNADYDRHFLILSQETANRHLRAYGFLFLNDIYEMLGMKKTVAGQAVGWVYDKDAAEGDNHVDFRIKEILADDPASEDGYIRKFLLDFNVDGPIFGHAENMQLLDNK